MTHIFNKKYWKKKIKKVIISSKKTFFVGIMHVFWSFFGFLVDFCVLYLVCMLSDIFRRNSGPVYWVNISISFQRHEVLTTKQIHCLVQRWHPPQCQSLDLDLDLHLHGSHYLWV